MQLEPSQVQESTVGLEHENKRVLNIEFVGDVVCQIFGELSKLNDFSVVSVHHDINQHAQVLLAKSNADILVSHCTAEYFMSGSDGAECLERVSDYCEMVLAFIERNQICVVLNTVYHTTSRVVGLAHMERIRLLADINQRLIDCSLGNSLVSIADIAGVVSEVGTNQGLSLRNQMVMSVPYTKPLIEALKREYGKVVSERFTARKKLIVLDADNTLWAGIVGEDGIEGISADGDYPGKAYRKFQEELQAIRESGILLALVSKNNEEDAKEAFDSLDMPLSWNSFVTTRVNWLPKSENIKLIASELSLGIESFIFVDDNPFEVEQVASALPAITVVQFPAKKPETACDLLRATPGLSAWSLSDEDQKKSAQYDDEKKRGQLMKSATTLENYIDSLNIRMEVGINRKSVLKRISQLTNKTNQFNLTTRRYSESDVLSLMERGRVFDFRIIDKFGDMGVVGVVIVESDTIDTFLMSCRALGRSVESSMLHYICSSANSTPLSASYIKTRKNGMVQDFYENNGFSLTSKTEDTKNYRQLIDHTFDYKFEIDVVTD